jgi:hypothetical protein
MDTDRQLWYDITDTIIRNYVLRMFYYHSRQRAPTANVSSGTGYVSSIWLTGDDKKWVLW